MSQTVGKLLPNLSVVLDDDDDDDDDDDHDIEMKDVEEKSSEESKSLPHSIKQNVKINSNWVEKFQKTKIYKNAVGGFTTGLDLMSEDNIKLLEKRAERFGEIEGLKQPESVASLYKSLAVPIDNKSSAEFKNLRLNAVHMRGVEEMNTRDIFNYFKDYGPDGVEWINDYSCNVVWLDDSTAARALLGLSKPMSNEQTNEETNEQEPSLTDVIPYDDDVQESQKEKEIKSTKIEPENKMSNLKSSELSQSLDVPVPPGHWRIGVQHPKAKVILLRFASNDDKKKPGSEKRSNYYKKYGNPNYGGLKGLISSSWKRRLQSESNQQIVKSHSSESHFEPVIVKQAFPDDDSQVTRPKIVKPLRMRMYADDEELNAKSIRLNDGEQVQESVHSRLGKKFTKDDLYQLGHHITPFEKDDTSLYEPRKNYRKRAYIPDVESDLRKKIKRLKDDKASKHRSPLCRDDA